MPHYKIAHVKEQGVNLIIIPLDEEFGGQSIEVQRDALAELQERSGAAGLAGTVVPVWEDSSGRMGFLAPQNFQPFFKSLLISQVLASLNGELYW